MTRRAVGLCAAVLLLTLPGVSAVPAHPRDHDGIRQRLFAPDAAPFSEFGSAVSASGREAIVGTLFAGRTGRAYIYVQRHGRWVFQQELSSPDSNAFDFGSTVAISGRTAFVSDSGSGAGEVIVFQRRGERWTYTQTLREPNPGALDLFGFSVAVSGQVAVIGAPDRTIGVFSQAGAADLYVRTRSGWAFRQELDASDPAFGGDVGWSVALDHGTVITGAPFDRSHSGAVYIFSRSGPVWKQTAELAAPGSGAELFGWSVSAEGPTLAVGAPALRPASSSVDVYRHTQSGWIRQATLRPALADISDDFGLSLSVRRGTLVVGDPDRMQSRGLVDVYQHPGDRWIVRRRLRAAARLLQPQFGESVATSGDTLFIGVPGEHDLRGTVDVYRLR